MGWFCQTNKAKKQLQKCQKNKCEGCSKCVCIEESEWAMINYGIPIEKTKHPLLNSLVKKFNGIKIN